MIDMELDWMRSANAAMAMLALGLAGCATQELEPPGPVAKETLWVVTADHRLVKFNAGQPQKPLDVKSVQGLAPGEAVVGIDYRVARGVLFALTNVGRLYSVDTVSGALQAVASTPLSTAFRGQTFGFDFNPTVDRIRVVNESGQNLRLHPDTGALASQDPDLAYAAGDANAGRAPQVVAAAYTYNTRDEKLTTNFAIDRALGTLVVQGSREGVLPAVSPNTGQLYTVGPLGTGPLEDVSFDISDVNNVALAALRTPGSGRTVLYRIDLSGGAATQVGTFAVQGGLRGLAIEP
jgi:hypothetical protein